MQAFTWDWRWCCLALPLACGAAEFPEPVLPAGVGVNIHFVTGHERDLDLIAAGGFKFIRMDFGWTETEPAKGQYPDLKPKPAYIAIQTLTRQLGGYRVLRRLSLADEKDYVMLYAGPAGANKLAAWTLAPPHVVRLRLTGGAGTPLTAVSGDGASFPPKVENSGLVLELGALPQYVALADAQIAEPEAPK